MDTVEPSTPLKLRIMFIDLKDHGVLALSNMVLHAKFEMPRPSSRSHPGRIPGRRQHLSGYSAGGRASGRRRSTTGMNFYETAGLKLALIVADMPAVVGEALLFRISLNDLNARADHQDRRELHIF